MEMWQSPVYCNSLENCRVERHREFESHRFRQLWLRSSVRQNVGLQNQMSVVQIHPGSPIFEIDVGIESLVR